jgi:nucleotide-binding universal stress UspA family protein
VTTVVGLPHDERRRAALHLAAMLARSAGDDVAVCTVVPEPWPPGMARIDAEYHEQLDRDAAEALDLARELVPPDVHASFEVVRARSVPAGLLETAERYSATQLTLGSSAGGILGRVAFGSVADRLLHSSPVPVALAPRGFRCRPDAHVTRVTAAFGAAEGSTDLVIAAAGVAARVGAALRVASFAVRPRTPLTAGIGSRAEAAVAEEWSTDVEKAQHATLAQVAQLPAVPRSLDAVIAHGTDWEEALEDVEWADGDVLVVGSSAAGPIARVFLGSRSSKIVRNSPVPVVAVPRGRVAELADEAELGA